MAQDKPAAARSRPRGSKPAGRGRTGPGPAFAAIDLGTNNCRMLVARRAGRSFRIIDAFSRIVRLGGGLTETGRLNPEAMDRVVEALEVCAEKMERREVIKYRAVATQACRLAENGEELMQRIKDKTGLNFDIISPEEEARLAVLGCLDLMDEDYDVALVVDIGGGSTELSWVDLAQWRERGGFDSGGRPPVRTWASAPVGVVTLSERIPEAEHGANWYEAMRAFASDALKTPRGARKLKSLFDEGRAHMIGTSGTITSVAGVHMQLPRYERALVDGSWMTAKEARDACQDLASKDLDGRAANPVIGTDRADLVLAGCAILEAVLDKWPVEKIRVGDRGLREGLLLNLMRKPKRRRSRRAKGAAGNPPKAAQ
ncbi:Ppx/GppA phosphatase family protein [Hyphobacterium sp. HN65]|uniref:Ppx/GppA phosphatase family protein n=1 Tax=Hyphobacterium lacteum TaxID=3116575 RepID=A0ABU7LTV8_9PROT|nr:Ppx/GppA phosphatase family protein [Hyphobacterium sp. HN65]MEE2527352.1 Ppx/GppA phosphatase family protein [Hyphobacterium sp. HN65]